MNNEILKNLLIRLTREIACNRAYIVEIRGEGNFFDVIDSEEARLEELVDNYFKVATAYKNPTISTEIG